MKVLHTIAGFGEKNGGTSTATYDLLSAIHSVDRNFKADILTPETQTPGDRLMGAGEEWIKSVENDCFSPLAISKNLKSFLKTNAYDVYHTNGLWMYANHITCKIARDKGKPYVITPHGMLYPEALARSSWKKRPMRVLWFDKDIKEASCIHVTCEDELNHVRKFGYGGPIAMIANPVNIPAYTQNLYENHIKEPTSFLNVAFLGRLHPIKKVENLLLGASLSTQSHVNIHIIGQGDMEYEQFLKSEAKRLNLADRVHFAGFVKGEDKFGMLSKMDALFVPSDMENFGMIIPEAMIVGTPVMASLGTPWKSLNEYRCGWWRDNSPKTIAATIDEIYSLSPQERHAMSERGRKYILDNFASSAIAGQMLELYAWLCNEVPKPEFVYC